MRYQLKPIFCRPWTLNSLSPRLIESHYENHYGGALRRLNSITENSNRSTLRRHRLTSSMVLSAKN